jgi:hypothetical protein
VNELQIIRDYLTAERQHLGEVSEICAAAARAGAPAQGLLHACADYFGFIFGRLDENSKAAALARRAAAAPAEPLLDWKELLTVVGVESAQRSATITQLAHEGAPIAQWRATARVDADSILGERRRFEHIRALRAQHV